MNRTQQQEAVTLDKLLGEIMNCPKCEYKMSPTDLDCPRCEKFSLTSDMSSEAATNGSSVRSKPKVVKLQRKPTLGQSSSSNKLSSFKPTWFDYVMQGLTVLVLISQHGLALIVAYFYGLLILAYVVDWCVKGVRRLKGKKT